MSGIAGIYYLNGRPVGEEIDRMVEAIEHRGPDGIDTWRGESVGLGQCMLHTTPESLHEQLPYVHSASGCSITADARIDNRDALLSTLDIATPDDRPLPDGQLILAAYLEWAEDCVDHLLGAFAFSIWDPRRESLFCAVDHLGVKQFYYTQTSRGFAFGSEMKSLLLLDDVRCAVDTDMLAEDLAWIPPAPGSTIFSDLRKLPPAHTITVSKDVVRSRKYWKIEPSDEAQSLTEEECTARFKELFAEAVECRLRSAFPVGTELSGGLDSSSVTCMASELLPDKIAPLRTFSLVFDEIPECDEREYITQVTDEKDIVPHYVKGDALGPVSTCKEVFEVVDDGRSCVGNTFLRWHVYKRVREKGVRIILTGTDGDTTVSHGLERFAELAAEEEWQAFQDLAEAYVCRLDEERGAFAIHGRDDDSPERIVEKVGFSYLDHWATTNQWHRFFRSAHKISTLFDIPFSDICQRFWKRLLAPPNWVRSRVQSATEQEKKKVPPIIDEDFARRADLQERLFSYRSQSERVPSVRKNQLRKFRGRLIGSELQHYDQYSTAHSVETRHPFMDIRLIQFCLGMSSEMSFQDGWTRAIMRRSMKGIVPETVRWRVAKTNMSAVFDHGLLQVDSALTRSLLSDLGPMERFVNKAYMQHLVSTETENHDLDFTLLASVLGKVIWAKKLSEHGFCKIESS